MVRRGFLREPRDPGDLGRRRVRGRELRQSGVRVGCVGVTEDFGAAVMIEDDGFQAELLSGAERYVSGEDVESPMAA